MTIQPLHDKILVSRSAEAEMSAGGLHLPTGAQKKELRGEVLAVGGGRIVDGTLVPLTVAPGDVVLFGKFAGDELEVDGEHYLIMSEQDVFAILK